MKGGHLHPLAGAPNEDHFEGVSMGRKYTKRDFARLIHSDWSSFEGISRVDDAGIWLLEENNLELLGLSEAERDLFLEHPDRDANKPLLPFEFTMDDFLKFALLPTFELRDFYTFADNTVDIKSIEKLDGNHAPTSELARALMFGELPTIGDVPDIAAASGCTAPVDAAGASVALPKQRRQEQRILELLKAQGYAPLSLPKKEAGTRGAKAEIKKLALPEVSLFSDKSFDKAWERLRGYGDVADC